MREHRQGRLDSAKDAYSQALTVAPDDPDALNLMGTVLLQLGQAVPAVGYLERAAQARRNQPDVLGNLAQAYFALARFEDAREMFRKASRLEPGRVQFQMGMANSLAMLGKLAEAESILRRLASRHANDPLIWFNLGNVLRDLERPAEAMDCFVKALALDPAHIDARNNLGGVLQKLFRFEDAEREYRACLARAPDYALAKCNLASVLIDVGRFSEAETVLREVVAAAPEMGEARAYLGAALGHQGKLREALIHHREGARLAPSNPRAVETYMAALLENGYIEEGLRWLERAQELSPGSPRVHQSARSALLASGYMVDGWNSYDNRPSFVELSKVHSGVSLARTLPARLAGRHICLLREQGLGDEIFFLRYAPLLKAAGARLTYLASNKIGSLFRRVDCLDQVLPEDAPVPQADAVMLLGDLPIALSRFDASPLPLQSRTESPFRVRGVSRRISVYWPRLPVSLAIPPLESCLEAMRKRLAGIGDPPYIALTWSGGTPPEIQRNSSAWLLYKDIGIQRLGGTLQDLRATFIAVQRKPRAGEIAALSKLVGREVHDFTDLNSDLENMLAVLAIVDEYVGVSNTNMHLRAAAGRTARVLVPQPAEWRWMASGAISPWFPGFSVYRQSPNGDWIGALAKLKADLAATAR